MKEAFAGIHYPFSIDEAAGRLRQEPDYERHVEQLIRQVLLTSPGERVNRPDFGCGLKQMVFAPDSELAATLAQATVFEALSRWLPDLIAVREVKVAAEEEKLIVRIAYTLKANRKTNCLNLEVTL